MTEWKNISVSCPACFTEGEFRVCSRIDISESPELLKDVYSRDLFRYKCGECDEEIIVAYDCTVIDEKNKTAVLLIASDDEENKAARLKIEGFTIRVVHYINAFVEKLALFEDKIDDKVIELYKIMLEDQFEEEKPDAELLGIYYGGLKLEDNTLSFYIITGNAENTRASLSMDTYYAIEKQLEAQSEKYENDIEIDRDWALKILEKWGE